MDTPGRSRGVAGVSCPRSRRTPRRSPRRIRGSCYSSGRPRSRSRTPTVRVPLRRPTASAPRLALSCLSLTQTLEYSPPVVRADRLPPSSMFAMSKVLAMCQAMLIAPVASWGRGSAAREKSTARSKCWVKQALRAVRRGAGRPVPYKPARGRTGPGVRPRSRRCAARYRG